jgi:methionyl-tRNA formyltransferase
MKALLITRYPRVDSPAWKRRVAGRLLDAGWDLEVLYSQSSLVAQVRAGIREEGWAIASRYRQLRGTGSRASAAPSPDGGQTLADWAEERGIPVHRVGRLRDDRAVASARRAEPDLLVLLGADIVPAPLLAVPTIGTINAHYGLLPAYRGMNVTEWSVLHGNPVGVTVHLVDPGIDTGDILVQEELTIEPGETWESLRAKHQDAAARLLGDAAIALADGTARRTAQSPDEGRQYYRMHPALRRVAEDRLAQMARAARADEIGAASS